MFQKDVNHIAGLRIFELFEASEWGSQAFIIPKKDGLVQQINDLQLLNKAIVQKIPTTHDN